MVYPVNVDQDQTTQDEQSDTIDKINHEDTIIFMLSVESAVTIIGFSWEFPLAKPFNPLPDNNTLKTPYPRVLLKLKTHLSEVLP